MEAIIGFVLGLLALPLYRRLTKVPPRKAPAKRVEQTEQEREAQEAFLREYRRFLNYDGSEQ